MAASICRSPSPDAEDRIQGKRQYPVFKPEVPLRDSDRVRRFELPDIVIHADGGNVICSRESAGLPQ